MPRAKRSETVERVKVDKLRTLGREHRPGERARAATTGGPKGGVQPQPTPSKAMQTRARDTLRREFDRVMAMQQKLVAESKVGGTEKGRSSPREAEKVRSLVASLEGMNRFALQMGLITPAESRELYADAMKRGLYQGWR